MRASGTRGAFKWRALEARLRFGSTLFLILTSFFIIFDYSSALFVRAQIAPLLQISRSASALVKRRTLSAPGDQRARRHVLFLLSPSHETKGPHRLASDRFAAHITSPLATLLIRVIAPRLQPALVLPRRRIARRSTKFFARPIFSNSKYENPFNELCFKSS